jgi:two-component system response regulator (stage 0 sporulation protein F)
MNPPLLMLIDDEFGVRESLKMVFGKSFRLIEADSVDAALPQVESERPDVILLDMLMPKTDGLAALVRIKEIHPSCAVLMLSGVNSPQLAAKALELGAVACISKPFDVIDLRQKVARAIEQFAPGKSAQS